MIYEDHLTTALFGLLEYCSRPTTVRGRARRSLTALCVVCRVSRVVSCAHREMLRGDRVLVLSIEKRINFTLEDLAPTSKAYDHFRSFFVDLDAEPCSSSPPRTSSPLGIACHVCRVCHKATRAHDTHDTHDTHD